MYLIKCTLVKIIGVLALTLPMCCRIIVAQVIKTDIVKGCRHLPLGIFMYFSHLACMIRQQLHVLTFLKQLLIAFKFVESPEIAGIRFEYNTENEIMFVVVFGFGVGQVNQHLIIFFLLDL